MLKIVEKTKLWFAVSLFIIIIGMGFLVTNCLNLGIDFKGGTVLEIKMNQTFNKADVDKIVDKYAKNEYSSKTVDDGKNLEVIVKNEALSPEEIGILVKEIKTQYKASEFEQDTIGGSVGNELKSKALIALFIATICMLAYIGFRFEFRFVAAAIIALLHDVLITV